MSSLEERQKDCRLYIDRIGDVLQSHMENMRVYTVTDPKIHARVVLIDFII